MSLKYFFKLPLEKIIDKLILLDIDGTIVCDCQNIPQNLVIKIVNELKKNNEILLLTNNSHYERTQKIAQILNLSILISPYRKPDKRVIKNLFNKENRKILVIGDKYFTDKIFASKIQADFLRIKRIQCSQDRFFIKVSYFLDNIVWFIFDCFKKIKKFFK